MGNMSANAQLIGFMLAIGVPCLTSLLGVLISNSRIGDLRAYIDSRFSAQEKLFSEKLQRVEEVLGARLTRIEDHLHLR